MNEEIRIKAMKDGIEMYESLQEAVSKAGGCGFTADVLSNITAMELISRLATNGIRFIYKRD